MREEEEVPFEGFLVAYNPVSIYASIRAKHDSSKSGAFLLGVSVASHRSSIIKVSEAVRACSQFKNMYSFRNSGFVLKVPQDNTSI